MKKSTSIEEERKYQMPSTNLAAELVEFIENMFDNVPDKRKKEYKEWLEEINKAIDKVNSLTKQKIYVKR